MRWRSGFVLALWAAGGGASAKTVAAVPDSDGADTARQLSNPLASIISVPFRDNIDFGGRTSDTNCLLNVQPVVPIRLTSNLTLIARTMCRSGTAVATSASATPRREPNLRNI
jgi:hypothetical protein